MFFRLQIFFYSEIFTFHVYSPQHVVSSCHKISIWLFLVWNTKGPVLLCYLIFLYYLLLSDMRMNTWWKNCDFWSLTTYLTTTTTAVIPFRRLEKIFFKVSRVFFSCIDEKECAVMTSTVKDPDVFLFPSRRKGNLPTACNLCIYNYMKKSHQ